jgi:hypothetical protein
MSSTIKKLFYLSSFVLLFGITKVAAQQDCNATSVSMSCNNLVNLSLGTSCSQTVKPQDLLTTNSFSCYNNFTVSILNTTFGNTVGAAQIGKTYDVKVTHTLSGNSCWGKIKVEDKNPPSIGCSLTPISIGCADTSFRISYAQKIVFDNIANNNIVDINLAVAHRPIVIENCNGYTLSYNDQVQNTDCSSSGKIAIVTRTWTAKDAIGNSSVCSETYNIVPESLDNIMIPADVTLDCGDTFVLDANGNPSPTKTGFPTLNGIKIDGQTINLCQIAVGYQDKKTVGACSGYTVVRKWTLTNWCENSNGVYGPVTKQIEQLIHVKDTKKPSFTGWNLPYVIPTDINKCYISSFVPTPPQAKDNCDASLDFTYELYNSTKTTLISSGKILKNIPPGWFLLIATATDDCGNSDTLSTKIEVKDQTPPVASCDQNTKVSLTVDGSAIVNATTFNDGSYDNCCIDTVAFDVRRMSEDDSQFRKRLQFNCADVNTTVQVVLRVWDCNGNNNTCMVNALVEDKMPPIIFAEDGTVQCGGEPAARLWLDDHKPTQKTLMSFPSPSNPGYYDNCSANLTYVDVVGIDACSKGTIKRVWTATDPSGRIGTTIQTVTAENRSAYTIVFPSDITINCETPNINTMPSATGVPKIIQEANSCANVTTTYEDKIVNNGGCRRITRIWKVLNLCANSMLPAPNVYAEGMQFIHIIDKVAPEIGNIEVITTDAIKQCYATTVELTKKNIKDNCATDITATYTSTIPGYEAGYLPATLKDVPYGKYSITYRATDNCGNFSSKLFDIVIKDTQKPTPVCHDNLGISLGSTGQAMLMARQVDRGSSDNCTAANKLKYRLQVPAPKQGDAFDITKTDTMHTFRCPTTPGKDSFVRIYPIALWIGDENDNWDYCETVVVVQDNMKMCPPIANQMKTIAGIIATNDNKPVEGVNLSLSGNAIQSTTTGKDGAFLFKDLPVSTYDLTPEKNDYPLNGVTTYDLVLMSKHILGVGPFTNANQFIAADVNKNGQVTTADVVELRKMILGLQIGFAKNTSWRFVERGQVFSTNTLNWLASLPNKKQVLNVDNTTANFTAIKVGDINQNAKTHSLGSNNILPRSQNILTLNIDQNQAEVNEIVTLTFSGSEEMNNIEGYQMALNYDKNSLELLHIHGNQDAFAVLEEGLISHSQVGTALDNTQLFGLTFRAKQNTDLTQAISLNERVMQAEAYDLKGEAKNIALKFKQKAAIKGFEVYQNQPNPFNGATMIGFQLPEAQLVKLTITDISGRVLKTVENNFDAGYQQFTIERNDLNTSGLLYYQVATPTQSVTKKMIILE